MEIRRRSRENEQTNGFLLKSGKLPVKSVLGQAADPWVSQAFRRGL
jgi:hypothetical protein